MPKGVTKYTRYELAIIKAARQLSKAVKRLVDTAAELEARPDPKTEPKAPKPAAKPAKVARQIRLSQLTIPTEKRKAVKAPAKRKRA